MHVTIAEAALAGAAITALGSAITGISVQRSTHSKDHLARLWERQAELYGVLLDVLTKEDKKRNEVVNFLARNPPRGEFLDSGLRPERLSNEEIDSLLIKLRMFGSPDVVESLTDYNRRNTAWFETLELLWTDSQDLLEDYENSELFDLRAFHIHASSISKTMRPLIEREIRRVPRRVKLPRKSILPVHKQHLKILKPKPPKPPNSGPSGP